MITLALERLRLDTGEIETTTPMEFRSHAHVLCTVSSLNRNAHVYRVVYLLPLVEENRLFDMERQEQENRDGTHNNG